MKYAFENLITFSRASQASYFNSAGQMTIAAAGEPRFEYDPVTLQPRGFLVEEQRTNRILNSAAPVTQNVTVSNQPNTLSFYGTGTVTLSGAHTATVVGTGAFPTRTNLLFTPAAGTLTVTISGDVQYMNLGPGAFATSWIPTLGAQATRLADSAKIDGANFAAFYKQSEGTLMAEFIPSTATNTQFAAAISDNTFNNRFSISRAVDGLSRFRLFRNSVSQDAFAGVALANNTLAKIAYAFNQTGGSRAVNGATATSFTASPPVGPVADRIYIGADEAGSGVGATNGYIRRIMYIPKRLSNTELQALTI